MEVSKLKLRKCYHFMILFLNAVKMHLNDWQPVKVLKLLNDRQSHFLLKFKETKEPIQFKLSYVDPEELYRSQV